MSKGICFFITPIGDDNSPQREQADALRDNVLKYSCEPFELDVIRADQIKGDNDINKDIVDHVKTAEVCVVDLTGLNSNVMFEFGLRQQTGLPVVVLAKKGTRLPFDVFMKRTIFFEDINSATTCNSLIQEIREHLARFEADGYRKISSEPTLTDIYTLLESIDRKVSTPMSFVEQNTTVLQTDSDVDKLLSNLNPTEAFQFAYKTNQIKLAEQILDLLKDQPYKYYLNKVCALANKGSIKAMQELEQRLPGVLKSEQLDVIMEIIGSLVSCYLLRDLERDKMPFMDTFFKQAYEKATSNRERATVLNQKQRMLAGAQYFEDAKALAEQIIQLNDEEPVYYFNYATILESLNDIDEAKQQVKKGVKICKEDNPDAELLVLACNLLKNSTNKEDRRFYEECLSKLEKINPYKARLTRFL